MREPYRRLVHVLFALATFAFSPVRAADACTCVMATCGDLAKADAVFEATIVSIEDSVGVVGTAGAASATFINGGGSRIVKLKDVRSWRGEAPSVLFTGQGGGDCGYDFQAGERYLIEASRSSDGQFSTTPFSRDRVAARDVSSQCAGQRQAGARRSKLERIPAGQGWPVV
jgi:hypothetical protein